jgi:phospholipid-transporting ATPase
MEGERRIIFTPEEIKAVPASINEIKGGRPNRIRTAKFTPLSWLPKSLFHQFQRVANIYFLAIVVLVVFPWSPKDWKSKVFPFCFVLLWTALKDLHEDSRRRRDDNLENHQKSLVFQTSKKTFYEKAWQDIIVGDVLLLECDRAFPADLVLLYAGGGHEAFISTISLDGETNLKERRPPVICDGFKVRTEGLTAESEHASDGGQAVSQDAPISPRVVDVHSRPFIRDAVDAGLHVMHQMHVNSFTLMVGKPEVAVQDVRGSIMSDSHLESCPLAFSNFLPRGCTLRNTTFALAIVVFVGDETKTRLNMAKSSGKTSNMQKYLNHCVWGLLTSLLLLCIYAATMSVLQEDEFQLCCGDDSWLVKLGIFTITFYHVVPMSLYVCFEMLKLILGYQVNNDPQMIDPESGDSAVARTADLIEEMGQINFVFSDKTGTLTKNEMIFARACINGQDVGDFRMLNGMEPEGINRVRNGLSLAENSKDPFWRDVNWFFTCLATCHSVQVSKRKVQEEAEAGKATDAREGHEANKDTGEGGSNFRSEDEPKYLGMSPDEVALVEAARQVGIVFKERSHKKGRSGNTSSEVTLSCTDGSTKAFSILYELEFSSDRKRMSVIMRLGSELHLITKGADNVMEGLIDKPFSESYKNHLKQYSQDGLRTLVIAHKKLDRHLFRMWERDYKDAQTITDNSRDQKVCEVQAAIEKDLKLLGITGVEDCLQDGVPEAIATIKAAGVRVWVLTGDKVETAVDIAHSCRLFTDNTTIAYAVDATSEEDALSKLQAARTKLEGITDGGRYGGLVMDGITIKHCLPSAACKDLIFQLGMASRSCVCCRLTPLQKRNLVDIVVHRDPKIITLAIGDGANDVPMIEGAHLGVAVRGKEGAQAVQVSDVAISQFRFLVPLLLCHGRRAYRRVALYLCYYLYKNVALLMGDVVWMHMDKYRGRIAFPEYLSINYNVFFTSWHILFVLGWDSDVPDVIANTHPHLYHVGPKRVLFNKTVFTRWMLFAVYHGCAAWVVPAFFIIKDAEYDNTKPGIFWEGSITAFTVVIFVVMLKLLINCQSPWKFKSSILPTLGAILCYIVIFGCISYVAPGPSLQPSMKGLLADWIQNTNALMVAFILPLIVISVDVVLDVARMFIWPTPLDTVKAELRKEGDISKKLGVTGISSSDSDFQLQGTP